MSFETGTECMIKTHIFITVFKKGFIIMHSLFRIIFILYLLILELFILYLLKELQFFVFFLLRMSGSTIKTNVLSRSTKLKI